METNIKFETPFVAASRPTHMSAWRGAGFEGTALLSGQPTAVAVPVSADFDAIALSARDRNASYAVKQASPPRGVPV